MTAAVGEMAPLSSLHPRTSSRVHSPDARIVGFAYVSSYGPLRPLVANLIHIGWMWDRGASSARCDTDIRTLWTLAVVARMRELRFLCLVQPKGESTS